MKIDFKKVMYWGSRIILTCIMPLCLYSVASAQLDGYKCTDVPSNNVNHSTCSDAPIEQCGLGVCKIVQTAPFSACQTEDTCYTCSTTDTTGTQWVTLGSCTPDAQGTYCACREWGNPQPKIVTVKSCADQEKGSC